MKKKITYSTNKLAEKIVGKRIVPTGLSIIFDEPCSLDYHCPVCKYEHIVDGNFDERLQWSEYNGFIWCSVCNVDYPSVLCQPNIEKAIEIYLTCVHEAKIFAPVDIKTIFDKIGCPHTLTVKKQKFNANITVHKSKYYICYTSETYFLNLDVDCEIIEGEGKELEDAIIELKKMLKDKKLIK